MCYWVVDEMTVVHIGFKYGVNDTGGAAIASTRLHLALLEAGVDSHYVTITKCQDGPNVHVLPEGRARTTFFGLTKLLRGCWKLTPYRRSIPLNVVPLWGLERLLKKLKPDAVHVQWINADVCSFAQLSRLRCPIVFNLHDLFLMLHEGGCPSDDRYLKGYLRGNSSWLNRWLVSRKARLVAKTNPVFIGPSEWVAAACRNSIVGRGHLAFPIPNIIDKTFAFKRDMYHPGERFVILFGAFGGTHTSYKGWPDLVKAFGVLPENVRRQTEVHVFGEEGEQREINDMPLKFLGKVSDPQKLCQIYHEADVFAFPSVQETQGMTKIEAMLCGLPVIAFDRTACAEGIEHAVSGWIAPDGDISSYAEGLVHYFEMWKAGKLAETHAAVARLAAERYDTGALVRKVMSVYAQQMGKPRL